MAAAEHPTSAVQPPEVQPKSQRQPEPSDTTPKPRRKTSFSDALNKFASNTFTRRRTTTNLPHSTTLASVPTQSRLPTPSGIPRSTSFFSTLNSFKSATTVSTPSTCNQIKPREKSATNSNGNSNSNHNGKENKASFPKYTSTSGIPIALTSSQKKARPNLAPSHRRVSTPYRHLTDPVTPAGTNTHKSKTSDGTVNSTSGSKSKSRRDSSVQITQHKLMQPLPPPLPKTNSSMSSLMVGGSANIVGSARTSMSSKRDSGVMVGGTGSGNAIVNGNINANANANANVSDASNKTPNQTETAKETKTPSPLATKAHEKTKSPSQTQTQTQSPPDVNKPLPDFHSNPLYVRPHPPLSSPAETLTSPPPYPSYPNPAPQPQPPTTKTNLHPLPPTGGGYRKPQIKEPQPSAYWCGRLSALNDRFRMEDITHTHTSSSSSPASPSNNHQLGAAAQRKLGDDERRTRRIFVHLQGLCVTDEARASLDEFQRAWEKKEGGGGGGRRVGAEKGKGGGAGQAESKGAAGFLDKLMGKR